MNGIQNNPTVVTPDFLSPEDIAILKKTILKLYPEDEQTSFIRLCQRSRLDPFTKMIYATKRMVKITDPSGQTKKIPTLVPVTSVIGLTAVADRTGLYDGCEIFWCGPDGIWRDAWLEDDPPAAAKCIVYRLHRSHPEVAIARWMSYAGQSYNYESHKWETSDFWVKMPDFMLGKCAKAAGLRGAFPDPLNKLYIPEELDSNVSEDVTEAVQEDEEKVAANQKKEADLMKEAKTKGMKVVEQKTASVPTPEKALEPAFDEDKIPAKPIAAAPTAPPFAQKLAEEFTGQPPVPIDDLDMGPAPAPTEEQWRNHVITGIGPKVGKGQFFQKKIGDLTPQLLAVVENQWLPAIRESWEDASEAQRADAAMFELALAYYKTAKPW